MVESGIKPIPEGFYPPKMENAEEIVRTMTYEKHIEYMEIPYQTLFQQD